MTEQQIELLSGIQRLCRTIRDEHGVYVTYTEHLHAGDDTWVMVSVCTGKDGENYTFERYDSTLLGPGSIEAVRDGLTEHLVKMREAA